MFKPEVPAKPMPCVVNTYAYFEDLDHTPNTEIGPKITIKMDSDLKWATPQGGIVSG